MLRLPPIVRRILLATTAVPIALLAALPVQAEEPIVRLTEVRFERFGGISQSGTPTIAVWITCDGTGILTDLYVELGQRGVEGYTNFDLLDAPCTTTPTRRVLWFDVFDGEFRPGRTTVTKANERTQPEVEWGTDQTIILRKGSLFQ